MKLYINQADWRICGNPRLEFTRGDARTIELHVIRPDGKASADDLDGIVFAGKQAVGEEEFVLRCADWTWDDTSKSYVGLVEFSSQLLAEMVAESKHAKVICEFELRKGDEIATTQELVVIVRRDVIEGSEGVDLDLVPQYITLDTLNAWVKGHVDDSLAEMQELQSEAKASATSAQSYAYASKVSSENSASSASKAKVSEDAVFGTLEQAEAYASDAKTSADKAESEATLASYVAKEAKECADAAAASEQEADVSREISVAQATKAEEMAEKAAADVVATESNLELVKAGQQEVAEMMASVQADKADVEALKEGYEASEASAKNFAEKSEAQAKASEEQAQLAQGFASDADASAQASKSSAEASESYATASGKSAGESKESAVLASSSAEASAKSASEASSSAEASAKSASEASSSAEASAKSASEASSSAEASEASAQRAEEAAQKADASGVNEQALSHIADTVVHITQEERETWNEKQDAGDYATNKALIEGLATKQDIGDYVTTEQAEETKKALEDEIATKQASGNYVPYYDAGNDGMWIGSYVSLVAGNHAGSHSIGIIPSSRISGSGGAKVAFRNSNNDTTAWIEESGAMYGFTKGNFTDNNQIVCQAEVDSSIETALESYTTTEGLTETLGDYAKTAEVVTLSGTQTISGVKTFSSAPKYASVLTSSSTDSYLVNKATLYRSVPVGAFMWFCGTEVPTGWLECDGSSLSRTSYEKLYAVIGTTYGEGDGDGKTFSLPDLTTVGRFIRSRTSSNTVGSVQSFGAKGFSVSITGIRSYCKVTTTGILRWGGLTKFYMPDATDSSNSYYGHQIVLDTTGLSYACDEERPYNLALIACIKY